MRNGAVTKAPLLGLRLYFRGEEVSRVRRDSLPGERGIVPAMIENQRLGLNGIHPELFLKRA